MSGTRSPASRKKGWRRISDRLLAGSGVHIFRAPRQDLLASLVVFLVALPLCMGIAIASGVDPAQGLITGIIAGLVVGFLTGSPLSVSGPAAGLTVIVLEFVNKYKEEFYLGRLGEQAADLAAREALKQEALAYALVPLGLVVFLAGCMQLLAGLLRTGQWFRAVSPAVIQGMLAGIGVLIFSSQFHVMVDDEPKGGGLQNLITIPEAVYKGLAPVVAEEEGPAPAEAASEPNGTLAARNHHLAAMTGILTILLILGWLRFAPRQLKVIPAPLVAVIVATLFATVMQLEVINVNVPENLVESFTLPGPQWLGLLQDPHIWLTAVVLAAVASAETLLCATAVDRMHTGPRTNYDRELFAQGVGNMACGMLGALPMTAVIVRSSANVHAGAKTPLSAILHGVWLLAFVVQFPHLLNYIPRSSLAAILVYTGYKLMNPAAVRRLWEYGKSEVVIYAITVATIVAVDLLSGIIAGLIASALKLLYTFSHLETRLEVDQEKRTARLYLEGAATFIRLPKLAAALEEVPPDVELHVDFEHLSYIDHACLDLLMDWAKQHEQTGGRLVIDWESLHANFLRGGNRNHVRPATLKDGEAKPAPLAPSPRRPVE